MLALVCECHAWHTVCATAPCQAFPLLFQVLSLQIIRICVSSFIITYAFCEAL